MRRVPLVLLSFIPLITSPMIGYAENPEHTGRHEVNQHFEPFTGRITRNKVRLRLQPNLESSVIKEMQQDQMLIIVGEHEDFYAIEPPKGTKAYVYRAFVMDGSIEADRVNVRLEPTVDAPVMAQLNTGDKISGKASSINNKWMEIEPPSATRFYISKDYVEKIGDVHLLARIEQRKKEVDTLIDSSCKLCESELQKPFGEIRLDQAYEDFSRVIDEYHDFPEHIARAKELIAQTQERYLKKKIKYLEDRAIAFAVKSVPTKEKQPESDVEYPEEVSETIEFAPSSPQSNVNNQPDNHSLALQGSMTSWMAAEKKQYEAWAQNNPGTIDMFYHDQTKKSLTLRGIIQPYDRIIKNKPGDYVLLSQANRQPIAYLYSTKVNLKDMEGQVVSIKVSPRENNNFAFPAYYVLEAGD